MKKGCEEGFSKLSPIYSEKVENSERN